MAKKTNVPLKRRRRSELNVKLIAIIAAVLFVVTIGIIFAVIGSHKKENNPSVADNQNNETTAEPTTEEETTTKVPTIEVDLMMIGDMLMHEGVVKSGLMDDGTYNFDHLYTNIAKDISSADIKIVNQETILGGSDFAYTGYPTFNSPWALGDAEVKAGFNIILHATNHTLDKGLKGVENCLSFWKTYHPDTTVLVTNPKGYKGYGPDCWGLTASYSINGYSAHMPDNDLGVITPTAALSSFPYTPEESMAALKGFYKQGSWIWGKYGFYDAFSPNEKWTVPHYLAIDQCTIAPMIENHRTGLLWRLFMSCPEIQDGLKKLGFTSTTAE